MAEVITVAALNKYVKSILESDSVLPGLAIRGEITNFVNHYKSGHWYFTLRDETASVKAVMFRQDAQRVGFVPEDGMRVVVRCKVSLYEAAGTFQLYVKEIIPDGVGAAQIALEQLKAKLEAEGLFAKEHKQPIPEYPQCVGVVTSATGAALQDIRTVMASRWPMAKILLAPTNMQGEHAAEEVCRGIRALDKSGRADVILVSRGGGSREDLWVFNDERIARAAYACKTPLISAIGHEIDFCILDFVADMRAPTPSAAAALAVPDGKKALEQACGIFMNIHEYMQKKLDLCYNEYTKAFQRKAELTPQSICMARSQMLDWAQKTCVQLKDQSLERRQQQVSRAAALAHSLSPYAVLGRGYAMVADTKGKCRAIDELQPGDRILLTGKSASAECRVESVHVEKEQKDEKAQEL